jgi:enoyl-CoA hydratase/carnithine racemase
MPDVLTIERKGTVDWVTMNRPERINALNDELTARMRAYFESLYRDTECRVVVLRGAGRGFCAGLDLESPQCTRFAEDGVEAAMTVQRDIRDIMVAMRRAPQPIVSLVHGAAAGGGFVFALASDIRIAAENARMNAAFIKIGLGGCDVGASYLLPRLIGASAAAELLFTGLDISASRALALGLVSRVVPLDALEDCGQEIVDAMLGTAPLGLRLTKQVFNANIDAPSFEAALALEDRNQVILGRTADFREGVAAFRAKRLPVYVGV